MGDEPARFEDTMDALEAQREVTEGHFRELLEELGEQVRAVRDSTERTTAAYQAQIDARRDALAAVKDSLREAAGEESLDRARAWPSGGSGWRGGINRLARWLIRDYLEVIDRRDDVRTRRVEDIKLRVDRLQETLSAESEVAGALEEALGRGHQALQTALTTHAEMLVLVNAKDAEVLQRAIAGPLRRMEVLFDEFGRQQEALLAQLVGRRRELDELVRAVTPAPEEEM
ncbi:MAG: hypothetical protein PVJ49_15265 [Acidobacteriota bacterium]|jgi:hypothetical protein